MATAITSPAKPAPATFTRIASQRDVGSPQRCADYAACYKRAE